MFLQEEKTIPDVNPIDLYVGKKVRFKRSIAGMSQEKLGKMLGITFQQVQKYEKGVNRIGASRLFEISKHLNVDVGYFFDGYEKSNQSDSLNETDKDLKANSKNTESKETIQLIKTYYKISNPEMKKKAMDILKAMADE